VRTISQSHLVPPVLLVVMTVVPFPAVAFTPADVPLPAITVVLAGAV